MSANINNAAYVLWMLAMGWCMGTTFDFYSTVTGSARILRLFRPVLDLSFWVVSALVVYYFTFITIQGEYRVYTFILLCVGYLVYRALFRRVVTRSAFAVVRFVKALSLFVGRILYRLIVLPIIVCLRGVFAILRFVYRIGCKIEDLAALILRIAFQVVLFPVRRFVNNDRIWRKKLRVAEQGFWAYLSNLVSKKPPSAS